MPPLQTPSIIRKTGASTDIDVTIIPDGAFRVVYIRVHFRADPNASSSDSSPNPLTISLDSRGGDQYDATLYEFTKDGGRGIGADANLIVTNEESTAPSPWSFHAGTGIKILWANPGGVEWGVELGYDPIGG